MSGNGRGVLTAAYQLRLAQRRFCEDRGVANWRSVQRTQSQSTRLNFVSVIKVIRVKQHVVLGNLVTGKADLDNAEPLCVGQYSCELNHLT